MIHIERPNRAVQKFPISCRRRVGNLVKTAHISSEQMEEPSGCDSSFDQIFLRVRRAVKSRRRMWFINYLPTRKTVWCAKELDDWWKKEKRREEKNEESKKSLDLSEKEWAKISRPSSKSRESTSQTKGTHSI